ncbi:MAG TPA: outer membrane protein assembly factor BamE [Clostridia bacterium]|nr:outer membrane protein assembly factor BamE [Clostridia bacterium]
MRRILCLALVSLLAAGMLSACSTSSLTLIQNTSFGMTRGQVTNKLGEPSLDSEGNNEGETKYLYRNKRMYGTKGAYYFYFDKNETMYSCLWVSDNFDIAADDDAADKAMRLYEKIARSVRKAAGEPDEDTYTPGRQYRMRWQLDDYRVSVYVNIIDLGLTVRYCVGIQYTANDAIPQQSATPEAPTEASAPPA